MKDTSGPAFPTTERDWSTDSGEWVLGETVEGLTKRDYFAGKALQSTGNLVTYVNDEAEARRIAAHCYLMADAMLAERGKP